ncbi:MAG: hypothetical protein WB683_12555 [Candidatus Sulfotelmatobacter sp.]
MSEGMRGNRWLDIALASTLAIVFVWLRSWSGLWQYGWTGVLFGLALGLYALRGVRASYDIARRYDIPGRVYIVGIVVFAGRGAVTLKHFLVGWRSDDGFFGILLLSLAINEALVFRRLRHDRTEPVVNERKPRLNHG